MQKAQDNTTTMMETTNGVLDANEPKWSAIPAFADAVNRAKSGVAAIREKQGAQAASGEADEKEAARNAVEEQTLMIADQLAAHAAKTADHLLAAKVTTDKSTLDRMAVSDLLVFARAVKTEAAAHHAVLASDYMVSAADLAAHDTAITRLDAMKTAPRDATVNRKVATMSLPGAINYVRSIYRNELDKMMTRFKTSDPDFYGAYFAARVIIDRGGAKKPASAPAATPA